MVRKINEMVNPITTRAFQSNLSNVLKDMSALKKSIEALEFCVDLGGEKGELTDWMYDNVSDLVDALDKVGVDIRRYGKVLNKYLDFSV